MKKASRSHHGTLNELNITPLLDLAFVLLVIFIITTPQMVNHLEMALPSGQQLPPTPPQPPPDLQRITLEDSGRILLNERPVTLDSLRSRLQTLKSDQDAPSVVVQGADEVAYESMVEILDLLRQLDITRVGLATQPAPPP